jgi:hypothetical protein
MQSAKNQRGFTFIQVLLAGSIGIALVYFLTSAMVNFSRSGNRIAAKMDLVQIKAMVTEALTDPEVCEANFKGKKFAISQVEDKKVSPTIAQDAPLQKLWLHRTPSDSTVVAYVKDSAKGSALTGEIVKDLRLVQWRKLEEGLYLVDLEIVPLETNGPLRAASVKGLEFRFTKQNSQKFQEIATCRKVGGLSEPPGQLIFPALGAGGTFPQRDSAEIANMTCHHAFGPTFECELRERFQAQIGEKASWGGVYRCGSANTQVLCPAAGP